MQERKGSETTESIIYLADNNIAAAVFGQEDKNLKQVERALSAKIHARGSEINLSGSEDEVRQAVNVFNHLQALAEAGVDIDQLAVGYALASRHKDDPNITPLLTKTVFTTHRGRTIKPKTFGQWQFIQEMDKHDITFAIGPAGTGKTFLAVLYAVTQLRSHRVSRLILARPAVEAGEKLGFLPGDLRDKVNPYLRPVYDALDEALGVDAAARNIDRGIIEVVPLAYMRGRTLNDAFIILDEAQNTTNQQMKMFLTRIGQGSRAVITGDVTQIDLPPGQPSGLIEAQRLLKEVEGLSFCYLSKLDVVRHPLVQKIVEAYEKETQPTN